MPDGNLERMPFTMDQKLEYVRRYQASGQSQEEFCRDHPVAAPRTLRAWSRMLRRPEDQVQHARAVVAEALEELTSLLKVFEAAGDHPKYRRGADSTTPPPGSAAASCQAADVKPSEAQTAPKPLAMPRTLTWW